MGDTTGYKQSFVTGLGDTSLDDLEGLGAVRVESDGKIYQWVKYKEGTAALDIAVGDPLVHVGDPNLFEVTADVSDATTGDIFGGVAQAAVTVTNTYLWAQKKGRAVLATALTAGAVGNALKVDAANDKKLTVMAAATDVPIGIYESAGGGQPVVMLFGNTIG